MNLRLREHVAFVLIAGDIFDGDWLDYNTGLYFVSQMARLREAGIAVFAIAGNHDAKSRMTRAFKLPDNVRYLATEKPETRIWLITMLRSTDRGLPLRRSSKIYPWLIHQPIVGCSISEFCTLVQLGAMAMSVMLLVRLMDCDQEITGIGAGHVHTGEQLCDDPIIAFPGNLQGRHIREAGPKGCLVVTVDDNHAVGIDFQPLDVLRWKRATVDISLSSDVDDALSKVQQELLQIQRQAENRCTAVRVVLTGTTVVHQAILAKRGDLQPSPCGRDRCWIWQLVG